MPTFYARKRTKRKAPVSFKARGKRVSFKARRPSYRRTKVSF